MQELDTATELEIAEKIYNRRKRIDRMKQMIIWLFVISTVVPTAVAAVMIYQTYRIEAKINDYRDKDNAYATFVSSGQALMSNPYVDIESLNGEYDAASAYEAEQQPKEDRKVYLTFDDGPSIYTGQILDILKANDVKATFFVIAKEDEMYVPYYRRIVEEGHTLGMHSYTHDYAIVYSSLDAFESDVTRLSDFLYERTDVRPTIYRFPGGSSNNISAVPIEDCIRFLNDEGIRYYDWNAMSGDAVADDLSAEQLAENVMSGVHKNDTTIVLMHDMQLKHEMIEALQIIIDRLKEEGYEILPIDEDTPLIQHIPYDSVDEKEAS